MNRPEETKGGPVHRRELPGRSGEPLVSVIIPSLDGDRDGNVDRLVAEVERQTVKDVEALVVVGVRPNGRARNVGVREARGEFLVCIDDDVTLGHDRVIENLLRPFEERGDVGLTGPSQLIPDDSTRFQWRSAMQLPRCYFPVQKTLVDSDMVSHMCLCMPTQLYKDLGWEHEDILSGTDPDLRHRVRQAGLRVVVTPDTWAYHPVPERRADLWRACYVKGRTSAWVHRHHPGLVLELAGGERPEFPARTTLIQRGLRMVASCLAAVFEGRDIFLCARLCYAAGYIHEKLFGE